MRDRTKNNPGTPAHYVLIGGSSSDHRAHGGRDLPQPPALNRREQVAATDHPATDRWVVLRTVRLAPTPLFWVGVVNGFNNPVDLPRTYPTLRSARRAANRLYSRLTEEEQ